MALNTSKEIERTSYNHGILLESIPELVLLVKAGKSVEFMNSNAIDFFGDLRNVSTTEMELCNIKNKHIVE